MTARQWKSMSPQSRGAKAMMNELYAGMAKKPYSITDARRLQILDAVGEEGAGRALAILTPGQRRRLEEITLQLYPTMSLVRVVVAALG